MNGVSCTVAPSQNIDPVNRKATFQTKTTCNGATTTMKQEFSEVDDCATPTTQITPGPGLGEVSLTTQTTCKAAASGKLKLSSDAEATDPTGTFTFNGTQSAQGTTTPGETTTATSTTSIKPTATTRHGAAHLQEAGLAFRNDASFDLGAELPMQANLVLQVRPIRTLNGDT